MSNWKFTFRQDQCDFIIATMNYIINNCENIIKGNNTDFYRFTASRTQERAEEIRNQIAAVSEE